MDQNYRLIIAFISKGIGIDSKANEAIDKYISNHPKKPALEKYRWGREGEIDFCLKQSELSTKEQKTFIEEVKKLAKSVYDDLVMSKIKQLTTFRFQISSPNDINSGHVTKRKK